MKITINQKIRLKFIDAVLTVHGTINRGHIESAFHIGPATATRDLSVYRKICTGAAYSRRLQSMIATEDFKSIYFSDITGSKVFLYWISQIFEGPKFTLAGSILPGRNFIPADPWGVA